MFHNIDKGYLEPNEKLIKWKYAMHLVVYGPSTVHTEHRQTFVT